MAGVVLVAPSDLYNILNQKSVDEPSLANVNYLLLLDVRSRKAFSDSHLITAKHVEQTAEGITLPDGVEVDTKKNIVVYDGRTKSTQNPNSAAVKCADYLWGLGSKYPVQILKGGFEEFSALYPFLRTQKILYTAKEMRLLKLYPLEVIPGFLYIGTRQHAGDNEIWKHLKIKAHVNTTDLPDQRYTVDDTIVGKDKTTSPAILEVPLPDDGDACSQFLLASSYLDNHQKSDRKSILIYSDLGMNRAVVIAMAFLIHSQKISLKEAWGKLKKCHHSICPSSHFVEKLSEWEEKVHGKKITDTSTSFAWY